VAYLWQDEGFGSGVVDDDEDSDAEFEDGFDDPEELGEQEEPEDDESSDDGDE